jgi:phytanoyl-CoA dioxygenase PhyH
MDRWFDTLAEARILTIDERRELVDNGFVVVSGPVRSNDLPDVSEAYDAAVAAADPADIHVGRTTTRVTDFVNRDPLCDSLYLQPAALDGACTLIGRPFRLSTMHARTVRPHAAEQTLHVDFERADDGWPMLGFIFMVDDFRQDNGATRFVPGSHERAGPPDDGAPQQLACGPAGSVILFNGSVWHGHSANPSPRPRRSIQGAYIRREATSGSNLPARMQAQTLARIGPLARYLIAV